MCAVSVIVSSPSSSTLTVMSTCSSRTILVRSIFCLVSSSTHRYANNLRKLPPSSLPLSLGLPSVSPLAI